MKTVINLFVLLLSVVVVSAQTFPDPEFSNEVYYLKKDNAYSLVRLEKNSAKQETKTNVIKGSEYGYSIEGKSSSVRFGSGNNMAFIFSKATSTGSSTAGSDSVMKANGIDPNTFSGFSGGDPSQITLYKLNVDGSARKIYLQKTGGYFGNHKNQTSDKYTFSLKKIRDGYWELLVDKPLPSGEYAFSMGGMGMTDMTGGLTVFAFGVD